MRLREHSITLHGAKVTLRPMAESDWPVLARWFSDPEVLYFAEEDDVQSRPLEDVQGIYRSASQTAFCFVIEVDGYAIGECWLQKMNLEEILARYPGRDCRRIDVMIGEKELWGRGYGTDAIAALTRLGFEQERADMIFGCGIADYNPRSLRAFEKNGYTADTRRQCPAGGKARWECDLALTREEYLRNRGPNQPVKDGKR